MLPGIETQSKSSSIVQLTSVYSILRNITVFLSFYNYCILLFEKCNRTENTYLSWKENPASQASSIHIRQVENDGITFREEWPNVKVIQADFIHDLLVTEGPWIFYRCISCYCTSLACGIIYI